jgi:hypothetical protein
MAMVKFCPECGSQLVNETSKFCDKCGSSTDGVSTTNQMKPYSGKEKTGGKPLTVEFILGLLGGIIGFLAGFVAIAVGSLGSAFAVNGASTVVGLGLGAIVFSIIGIIGAAIVKSKTKLAGYLMIISAIGGLICISAFYILSFILLIIAGIMAVRYKDQ